MLYSGFYEVEDVFDEGVGSVVVDGLEEVSVVLEFKGFEDFGREDFVNCCEVEVGVLE